MKIKTYKERIARIAIISNMMMKIRAWLFLLKRIVSKVYWNIIPLPKIHYEFVILCVKRPIYVKMAIDNCNSLHIQNPGHKVLLYCDTVSYKEFLNLRHLLDYPEQVLAKDMYKLAQSPWQIYKIKTLIDAGRKNRILVDADSIWYENPIIDQKKITLLVLNYRMRDNKDELSLVQKVYGKSDWNEFDHFATGLISIPKRFMTKKLQAALWSTYRNIRKIMKKEHLIRLIDELSINCAVQSIVSKSEIRTIKVTDGPMDKRIVQSLYYGCCNKICQ